MLGLLIKSLFDYISFGYDLPLCSDSWPQFYSILKLREAFLTLDVLYNWKLFVEKACTMMMPTNFLVLVVYLRGFPELFILFRNIQLEYIGWKTFIWTILISIGFNPSNRNLFAMEVLYQYPRDFGFSLLWLFILLTI